MSSPPETNPNGDAAGDSSPSSVFISDAPLGTTSTNEDVSVQDAEPDHNTSASNSVAVESEEERVAREEAAFNALQAECFTLMDGDIAELTNDNLLKVASVFSGAEIIERIEFVHRKPLLLHSGLRERMTAAFEYVSTRDNKSVPQLKAELEARRSKYGTSQREGLNEAAKQKKRKKKTYEARKAKSTPATLQKNVVIHGSSNQESGSVNEDTQDNGDKAASRDTDEEDATAEGSGTQTMVGATQQPAATARDFSELAQPTGYMAGQPGFIAGFRRYDADGEPISQFDRIRDFHVRSEEAEEGQQDGEESDDGHEGMSDVD